jgi:thioredoxin-related protein
MTILCALRNFLLFSILSVSCFSGSVETKKEESNRPVLYIFSSKTCPACWMMKPVVEKARREFADKLDFIEFTGNEPRKRELMLDFMQKVEVRYAPTFILSDAENRILAYAKGVLAEDDFFEMIKEGIEKYDKLPTFRISNVLYLCKRQDFYCKSWDEELDKWLSANAAANLKVEKFELDGFNNEDEFLNFREKINSLKYLSGIEFAPAIIFYSDKGEVIELFQSTEIMPASLSSEALNERLSPFMPARKTEQAKNRQQKGSHEEAEEKKENRQQDSPDKKTEKEGAKE